MKQKFIEALKQVDLLAEELVVDCSTGWGANRKIAFRVNGIHGMLGQIYFPIILEFCQKHGFHFYVSATGDIPYVRIYKF